MLDIKLDEEALKESTEDYFNIFYMNLMYSATDTMEMEFDNAVMDKNGKILLMTEVTIGSVDVYDQVRSRAKRTRFNRNIEKKTIYIDYDYLMEIGNSKDLELKLINNEHDDGTKIRYELSWANKEKFAKVLVKTDVDWAPKKKEA